MKANGAPAVKNVPLIREAKFLRLGPELSQRQLADLVLETLGVPVWTAAKKLNILRLAYIQQGYETSMLRKNVLSL